jgi:hypothetical protein
LLRCWRAEGEGEMILNLLLTVFTMEIDDTPTLAFEAQNLRNQVQYHCVSLAHLSRADRE